MLIKSCFLFVFALVCSFSSAIPSASVLPVYQAMKLLADLSEDVQRYSAVIKTIAAAQNVLSPENKNSDSINATRDALNSIIASINKTTESLESAVVEKGSSRRQLPANAFDVGMVLRNLVAELGSMSATVSNISTSSESFEDILHILFNALLALVNTIGGLLVGTPGIEALLRAVAALVSLFP